MYMYSNFKGIVKGKKKRYIIFKFMYNVLLDIILLVKVCFLK